MSDVPRRVFRMEAVDIIRFAGACGDFNPLHFDAALAARAGFDAPIAMGQMTAGMVASWLSDWCGVERLLDLRVRFALPVVAGDELVLTGRADEVRRQGDLEVAVVQISASVRDRPVLTGTALVTQGDGRTI